MKTEQWLKVSDVAAVMGCSYDTARARMAEMPDVVNVGSERRRQLMVPQHGLEDWMRNHRIGTVIRAAEVPRCGGNRMARMDRRTGRLVG